MFLRSPHDVCHLNILAKIVCPFFLSKFVFLHVSPFELRTVVEKQGVHFLVLRARSQRSRNLLFQTSEHRVRPGTQETKPGGHPSTVEPKLRNVCRQSNG